MASLTLSSTAARARITSTRRATPQRSTVCGSRSVRVAATRPVKSSRAYFAGGFSFLPGCFARRARFTSPPSCKAGGPTPVATVAVEVSEPEPIEPTVLGISYKNLRITASVCGWFFLNAVFAIYNKKTLNCFPYPWILSWIQIATGAALMMALWAVKLLPAPKLNMQIYKQLVPTATLHCIAHVSACASYNFSSVSFMQVVKAAEPVCSVVILTLLYGARFSPLVWLTLVPIVAGVAGGSLSEANFSMIAFVMAMISNIACALRGVTSKEVQSSTELRGINLYAAIAIVSSVLLLVPTLLVEGRFIQTAFENAGPAMVKHGYGLTAAAFIPFLLTGSVFYHLYNQTSYQALAEMNPLSHSVANTVKRVVIILASIAIFKNPITPVGAFCSAVAILGTFLYSLARQHETKLKNEAAVAGTKDA